MPARKEPPSVSSVETLAGTLAETLAETFIDGHGLAGLDRSGSYPCLTILYHPDLTRVGERAILGGLLFEGHERLSRLEPGFAAPGAIQGRSLRDPYLSRRPTRLQRADDAIEIAPEPGVVPGIAPGTLIELDGQPILSVARVPIHALATGVVLTLSRRVILLLHAVRLRDEAPPRWDLVGDSEAMVAVREQVARVAELDVPVLIRGETGVGKELVAQSIHRASRRGQHPLVAVNMAALAPGSAPSELFGHVRGAFAGADTSHAGLFERADHGTLLLDEIGETPAEVQTMLLRALAEGVIRPVGAAGDRQVDVRVIAATDADLDRAGEEGAFRSALRHRLAGYEIHVPPLRERREDIPRLVVHFLQQELGRIGEDWRLRPAESARRTWFPPELMLRLFHHDWPGNVRQLCNTVRQLVISSRGADAVRVDLPLARALAEKSLTGKAGLPRAPAPAPAAAPLVPAAPPDGEATEEHALALDLQTPVVLPAPAPAPEPSDDELLAALAAARWSPARAAERLGIARPTVYDRMERIPGLRKASELAREELERTYRACGGDLDAMVDHLRVSRRSIQLRMRALGLDYSGGDG